MSPGVSNNSTALAAARRWCSNGDTQLWNGFRLPPTAEIGPCKQEACSTESLREDLEYDNSKALAAAGGSGPAERAGRPRKKERVRRQKYTGSQRMSILDGGQ